MIKKTRIYPWLEKLLPWISKRRCRRFMDRIVSADSSIAIDKADFSSLFAGSGHVFSREYSTSAYAPDRMNVLVAEAKHDIKRFSSGHCQNILFYIFSPKCKVLMMDEMNVINEWLQDNTEAFIQWGYGKSDDDRIRMIVFWA